MNYIIYFLLLFLCAGMQAEDELPDELCQIKGNKEDDDLDVEHMEISLSSDCEPLSIVAGCVNVASGQFFQMERDFIGDTIDPIQLSRFYESNNKAETFLGYSFGCQFPLFATSLQSKTRHNYGLIEERNGFFIPYQSTKTHHVVDPGVFKKNYTNLCGGLPSGQSNHINWRAKFNNGWKVYQGDGTVRIYNLMATLTGYQKKRLGLPSRSLYLLTKEIKPNGNSVKYEYTNFEDMPYLSKVTTFNKDKKILNFIKFEHSSSKCLLKSSCGKKVEYFHEKSGNKILTKVISDQKGIISYEYKLDSIFRINKPEGSFVQLSYKDGKVETLNKNNEVYKFRYGKFKTAVQDPLKYITIYQFNAFNRPTLISYLFKNAPVKQERFIWSNKGNLKTKEIRLANKTYLAWNYFYDTEGNVKEKEIKGNLTGLQSEHFKRSAEAEKYSITYTYSKDKRNLLLTQTTPFGCTTTYNYLPETNLRTSVLQSYLGKIQERTFYTYDENGEVSSMIEDDGSGVDGQDLTDVTYRLITTIVSEKDSSKPSFGKPIEMIESYLCQGEEKVVTKKVHAYDHLGREIRVSVYDSCGTFCYKTTKGYDDYGRVKLETNPLKETTLFEYYNNHKKSKEGLLKSGKTTYYTYDLSGRMTSKTEKHKSGQTFETIYKRDKIGQLISETDPYEQETIYTYDRLGRQIKKEVSSNKAVTLKDYNILNQVIAETDPNGNVTTYSNNVYGSKAEINYPNGSSEKFVYYTNGWLERHWKANGTSIKYNYDPKGKVIEKLTFDSNDQLSKRETFTYKGKNLIGKQDSAGLITTYAYDQAGRKIEERIGSKVTKFIYDDFGRIVETIFPLGASEIYTYDYLDRITSKTKQDGNGKIYGKETYSYDIQGNEIRRKILKSEDNWITYSSKYGSDSKILCSEDPLGNRTNWKYDHNHINEKGQRVLACAITDALGRETKDVYDAFGRLASREAYEGTVLASRTEYTFDLVGNEVEKRAFVYKNNEKVREYWVISSYDCINQLKTITEMPEGRKTQFEYNNYNQLVEKITPDEISTIYSYDALGRLSSLSSKDVHYVYEYDIKDNPILVHDLINNTIQKRPFDPEGNLLYEEFSPEVVVSYNYDEQNRITKVTYPDRSFINYVYDSFHLIKVERCSSEGELVYECNCPSYDLMGICLQDSSPAGLIDYTYDVKSRKINIDSPFWKSTLNVIDPVGNLVSMTQNDPLGTVKTTFSYDRFDHLIQDKENAYQYDSLGNCLKKNNHEFKVNNLNQLTATHESIHSYDLNGNLIAQSNPERTYEYDSLNRLKAIGETKLIYDGFDRCLKISDKTLFYQNQQEIGSIVDGKIQELRVVHPDSAKEVTFAVEINQEPYFPIQDERFNITALRRKDGSIAQCYRFSPFGEEVIHSNSSIINPWRYANRRQIEGLSLFSKRLYNPTLMRWQNPDPLGFEDGLNLYRYARNNPLRYYDPDGRYVQFIIPLIEIAIGAAELTATIVTIETFCIALGSSLIAWSAYQVNEYINNKPIDDLEKEKEKDDSWAEEPDNRGRKSRERPRYPRYEDEDRQKNGTPGNNQDQNRQVQDATRGLDKNQKRRVHEEITGENYSYREIRELVNEEFKKR